MTVVTEAGTTVIRKSIVVRAPIERAFEVFTAELATWWPLETYSVNEATARTVTLEGWPGGRVYETTASGAESIWGTVTAWEPPSRVAFTWHPGREPDTAQDVDVRFTEARAGTRVELEHRGWEKLVEHAAEAVSGYETGWDLVLGRYAEVAGGAP